MKQSIQWPSTFLRTSNGVVSIEAALLFPVLLFILTLFFELARIALLITVVDISLERSVQEFRLDHQLYDLGEEQLSDLVKARVVQRSYGLIDLEDISISLQRFDGLADFSNEEEETDKNEDEPVLQFADAAILNITLVLTQDFMTPLPTLFSLGDSFQHEQRQVLGDLINAGNS